LTTFCGAPLNTNTDDELPTALPAETDGTGGFFAGGLIGPTEIKT